MGDIFIQLSVDVSPNGENENGLRSKIISKF